MSYSHKLGRNTFIRDIVYIMIKKKTLEKLGRYLHEKIKGNMIRTEKARGL